MNRNLFAATSTLLSVLISLPTAIADDDTPYQLVEIRDRDGKEIYRTAWGRGGRVGYFRDVDADGVQEFVALSESRRDLELSVLEMDTDVPRLNIVVGENEAAGLYTLNLDEDPALEFIVGYGSKLQDRVRRTLIQFASALGTMSMGWTAGNTQYFYMVSTGVNVDVRHIRAIDDDGSILWDRDFSADGENWNNPRFKWVASDPDGRGGTVLMTDDDPNELRGLSAENGSTIWNLALRGNERAARRQFQPLTDGQRELPVLFAANEILVLDPLTGEAVLDTSLERSIASLPSWQIYDTGSGPAFLAYGGERGELEMLSLDTGEVLWTHSMERVEEVLPVAGGTRLMAVWEEGVDILDAAGGLVANRVAPAEINRRTTPVFADLDSDGAMELLFASDRKTIVAWQPDTDEHLWSGSASSGMLGAANPVQIYESFYDIDDDGWLDVPAKKPSGAGVWLSGRTGEALMEVGNGSLDPIVGDFDGSGDVEVFWAKKWYEIVPTAEAD